MKRKWYRSGLVLALLVVPLMLSACGVPREALTRARAQQMVLASADTLPDDAVRARLRQQAAEWNAFAAALRQRELGGIPGVGDEALALVDRTAAVARRQAQILDARQDDPALNRALLIEFRRQWARAADYLSP